MLDAAQLCKGMTPGMCFSSTLRLDSVQSTMLAMPIVSKITIDATRIMWLAAMSASRRQKTAKGRVQGWAGQSTAGLQPNMLPQDS